MPKLEPDFFKQLVQAIIWTDFPDDRPGAQLLAAFVMCRRRGKPVPEPILAALTDAFAEILEGQDPKRALGLQRAPGRPRTPRMKARDARMVAHLLELSNSMTVDRAVEQVHRKFNVGEKVAFKLHEKHARPAAPRRRRSSIPKIR